MENQFAMHEELWLDKVSFKCVPATFLSFGTPKVMQSAISTILKLKLRSNQGTKGQAFIYSRIMKVKQKEMKSN